jgi:hypothetical protein
MRALSEFKQPSMCICDMSYILEKGYAILDQQNVHIKLRKVNSDQAILKNTPNMLFLNEYKKMT